MSKPSGFKTSIRRTFLVFSVIFFMIILVGGSTAFVLSMWRIGSASIESELTLCIETVKLRLATAINSELGLVLKMVDDPSITPYFLNPEDDELKALAFEEFAAYRRHFKNNSVFWINDVDRKFYFDDASFYILDPDDPESYWYNMTLYETEKYNFNINYNDELKRTNLWVNAPMFENGKPIGMLGTGIDLTDFIDIIYNDLNTDIDIYLFNTLNEITIARDQNLAFEKTPITDIDAIDDEILGMLTWINFPGTSIATKNNIKYALSSVPELNWYLVVSAPMSTHTMFDKTMTSVFIIMMALVLIIFFVCNVVIYIMKDAVDEQNQQLIVLTGEVEAASEAKSNFLASMSHEIRTPMNTIIGMSDLIRTDNMDERQKEFFDDIKNMSKSLLQIINDILDFSKIESGRMELSPVHFNLMDLYKNIASLNRFIAEGKGLEFRGGFDADVMRIVYGDDIRIRQIVTNLLSNAIKYTRQGFVNFRVKRIAENGQIYTAFQVEDSGIGVRKENVSRLFDWYEQFDALPNRSISGTGLGLPIAKRFTDMMNGRIDVKSEYGKGSTFTVLLPLAKGDVDKIEQMAAPNTIFAGGSANVLIVDDNAINLKVAVAYLETHNIQADTAESGAEALRKIRTKQYHLIFMDHMMPEMDGLETATRIRAVANEWYHTIPIIALSANAVSGARELFLASGMNDFISKPIEAGELNRMLAKWLSPDMVVIQAEVDKPVSAAAKQQAEGGNEEPLIDRAAGIVNAVGSETLYQQLLTDFRFSHNRDIQKIRDAAKAGEYQVAHRIAHTLKSTANLIGAKRLGNAALAMEEVFAREHKTAPAQSVWDTLEREFHVVMAELEQLAPKTVAEKNHKAGKLDTEKALSFIKNLEPLLDSGRSDSLNLLDDIREILSPAGEEYEDLISRINDLDFAEAVEILNKIKEKINGSML
jgi:signal transduction histidine kinase/DNA-binding NarL/FixJ family response regulator